MTVKELVLVYMSANLSDPIYFGNMVGDAGMINLQDWTAANLAFKASNAADGQFDAVRTQAGALVEISPVASTVGWYKTPDELRGAPWVKLWSETGGADVNQAATRTIKIMMKG